jgi:glycosyltransferase involved in cell wall biosynthesis
MQAKRDICFVTAAEETIQVFLTEHFKVLSSGYNVSVVTYTKNVDFLKPFGLDVRVFPLHIERKIAPMKDISSLLSLYSLLRRSKFAAVHSVTPKAGLLSMVAAFFARVPLRVHTFTGQVWVVRRGIARWVLKAADRLIALCATHILVDSVSQRDFLLREKVVSEVKSRVIAQGSICGVDTERFRPAVAMRATLRKRFAIAESDIVFLFVGRLAVDKGLLDLARAFLDVSSLHENVHLLLVGPDEEHVREKVLNLCRSCSSRIHFEDFTDIPEAFMASADVFCLPSYREGFGMAIIEAASVGIPAIGTRIYGVTDAIEEGITGYLYEPRNVQELAQQMTRMIEDEAERKAMGTRARERVVRLFTRERVTAAFVEFYESLFSPH